LQVAGFVRRIVSRWLLQSVGRYLDVRDLNSTNSTAADCGTVVAASEWHLASERLLSGWYMLEIEHDAARSVGCELTLRIDGCDEHLLLNSKKICKRIVNVPEKAPAMLLLMKAADPQLNRVSLVALSSRFAHRRMRQRLTYHTDCQLSALHSSKALYQRYREHFHQHSQCTDYLPRRAEIAAPGACARLVGRLFICAGDNDKASFHPSLHLAVKRAVELGACIEWIDAQGLQKVLSHSALPGHARGDQQYSESFLMPVRPGIQYRIDAMEQLLRAATSNTQLIYADHDHIDQSGQFHHPVLKPEWNPELLLNMNYIEHPFMLRHEWVVGQQSDGRTDNISLQPALVKAAFKMSADEVVRLPQVLATVQTFPPADHNTERWCDTVDQVLALLESDATVEPGLLPQSAKIVWPLPAENPSVDIIIPSRDRSCVLRTCVESILARTSYPDYRIHVIDNDSREPATFDYYESISKHHRVILNHHPGVFNYSAINNAAIKQSQADIILLLNNDTEVINEHWLDEMVRQAIRPDTGCVGAKLYYSNGMIQHGGVITGITGIAGHAHRFQPGYSDGYCGRLKLSQNFSAVTAACLAVRRETFEQVGGLDELELGVAWNDVDFCLRVQAAGFKNIWTPYAELFHHEGLTRGADDTKLKLLRARREFAVMQRRWHLDQYVDPAYHPHLTRDNEDFSLAA